MHVCTYLSKSNPKTAARIIPHFKVLNVTTGLENTSGKNSGSALLKLAISSYPRKPALYWELRLYLPW